jgi:NADH dehydrogenase [ubiquinone] 1 alpha subcomplex assembly factor 7
MAGALDEWWEELGRPDPYVVIEAGAGTGTLARDIIASSPACAPSLRYVLVERSLALRERQLGRLPLEPPGWALGPMGPTDPDEPPSPQPGAGPLATSLAELPSGQFTGVVLANELLDNMPFDLRRGTSEVRIAADDDDRLYELDVPPGAYTPVQTAAAEWLRSALSILERGRVVVIDYADTTESMAQRPRDEWIRTYAAHGRAGHPLDGPGTKDITCEVAVDQLAHVRHPETDRSQADFLMAHGLDRLVDEATSVWTERAHLGDLEAMKARSRVNEAKALTDPTGLGSFRVLEWAT